MTYNPKCAAAFATNSVANAALVIKKYLDCKEEYYMDYATKVKNRLFALIEEMNSARWIFTKHPDTDFSRKKKWSFTEIIKFIIAMEGKSIKDELYEYFDYDYETPSNSAFNQRRAQILPEAFEFLFREFTNSFENERTYNGYKLVACDGSDLCIAHNPADTSTYVKKHNEKGYNLLHLNALYDLSERIYIDALTQPVHEINEKRAMCDMVDRYNGGAKTIFIADRNYENYNIFAHIQEKGMYYLIRVKDIDSTGILGGMNMPKCNEFDKCYSLTLTKKQTKEIKANKEKYKFIPASSTFDYLTDSNKFYDMKFRVVRFPIAENNYECIITNLPKEIFPSEKIKNIYQMRWGIETSFRELKYAVGMMQFHAKKTDYIKQEIWARLLLYNFCEIITTHVVIEQKEHLKHTYQVNYTRAIRICCYFLKTKKARSDIEKLIGHELLPVRPGRTDPRKVKTRSAISFLYRVA